MCISAIWTTFLEIVSVSQLIKTPDAAVLSAVAALVRACLAWVRPQAKTIIMTLSRHNSVPQKCFHLDMCKRYLTNHTSVPLTVGFKEKWKVHPYNLCQQLLTTNGEKTILTEINVNMQELKYIIDKRINGILMRSRVVKVEGDERI